MQLDYHIDPKENSPLSMSNEFERIRWAKARGENPLKTVFHMSEDDIQQCSIANDMANITKAKGRGENPFKTVFGMSEAEAREYSTAREVESADVVMGDLLQTVPETSIAREAESADVVLSDLRDPTEVSRNGSNTSEQTVPEPSIARETESADVVMSDFLRRSRKVSRNGSNLPEQAVPEPSNTGATARKLSRMLDYSHAELTSVVTSDVKTTYEPKSLPGWLEISPLTLNRELKRMDKDRTQAIRAIEAFKDCLRRCEEAATNGKAQDYQDKLFEELRDHIHKAEVLLKGIDKYVIRKMNMLTIANGLPRIFATQNVEFPWDVRADAWQLYLRWHRQDFTPDLLRGIITRKGKDRASDRIDPLWSKDPTLKINARFHGQGHLVLGQWWPTQLCAVRDGAHGTPQGGIWGAKGEGAFSIVLSSGGYRDKDDGDEIFYSGTENKNPNNDGPTENTRRLIESCDEFPDRPVRVLRSAQLPISNRYRPKCGLRYDGLYKVISYEVIDKKTQEHLFRLIRCGNQDVIRCENNAARRPTKYEMDEYARLLRDGR